MNGELVREIHLDIFHFDENEIKNDDEILKIKKFDDDFEKSDSNWPHLEDDENAFLYRNIPDGDTKNNGPWKQSEIELLKKALKDYPPINEKWGVFSKLIPGRTGYQCKKMYEQLLKNNQIKQYDMIKNQCISKNVFDLYELYTSDDSLSPVSSPHEPSSPIDKSMYICEGPYERDHANHDFKLDVKIPNNTSNPHFLNDEFVVQDSKHISSLILENNYSNPIHFLLLSYPLENQKKFQYLKAIREILENKNGEFISKLVNLYIKSFENREEFSLFVDYVISFSGQ